LFTTFFEAESGYSLISVAETQIRMLLDHGYKPIVLVQENFEQPNSPTLWTPSMVDLRPVLPEMDLIDDAPDNFDERVATIYAALETSLADVDVCITHDIVLQPFYMAHNAAMRKYAVQRLDMLWLNWVHSRPTPSKVNTYPDNLRHTPPPGYLIYPNTSDTDQVAQAYNCEAWQVKSCRAAHAIDPLAIYHYHPLTLDLAQKFDLLSGDVTCVYPINPQRGKQPEMIIRLMKGVEVAGYEPRLLIVDWQSSGDDFQLYIDELLALASSLHLDGRVNFTSRLDDRCSQGVPRHVVIELMDLCNVYIHPSSVETYSLAVHEAMLRGLLCVLNDDWQPMHELFGDNAIYINFGSDTISRECASGGQSFWNDEALRMIAELKNNRAAWAKTMARREWSPQALWPKFESLLHLTPVNVGDS
jgi:glycosyltransferase involved in cell wall biosynthesis